MLLFGSSSMNGSFGHLMEEDFAQLGFRVTRHGYSAAGLARPDFRDLHKTMAQMPIDRSGTSVVLYIGGNDGQSLWLTPRERGRENTDMPWVGWHDSRWSSIYEARARMFIGALCSRGALNAIVLPPADVEAERLQGRLNRIRALLKRAAESTHCGRYVSTLGDTTHFIDEGDSLRAGDGVHMTRLGAARVWGRIRDTVLSFVLQPPPVAQLNVDKL